MYSCVCMCNTNCIDTYNYISTCNSITLRCTRMALLGSVAHLWFILSFIQDLGLRKNSFKDRKKPCSSIFLPDFTMVIQGFLPIFQPHEAKRPSESPRSPSTPPWPSDINGPKTHQRRIVGTKK